MGRTEGYHGEAKNWHGLSRSVRRGLENMKIQSCLTAIAVNLKRMAAAFVARLFALWTACMPRETPLDAPHAVEHPVGVLPAAA